MQNSRRTPTKVMEHVASLLIAAIASLNEEIHAVLALGISFSNDVLEVKCGAQRAADVVKDLPSAADHRRMEYLLGWVESMTDGLKKLQFAFYSALCTKDLLRLRINALHPSVYSFFWERIEARMSEWDTIRLTPKASLADVRASYGRVIEIIEKAEAMPASAAIEKDRQARIAGRLHLTLSSNTPKPAPQKNHKRSLADRERTQAMKGVNPPVEKHGHAKRKQKVS